MKSKDTVIAFTSFGQPGLIRPDGSGELYPDLSMLIPSDCSAEDSCDAEPERQRRWQWGPVVPDGSGVVVTSFEETAIEKIVVGDLRTRCWILDFSSGMLTPILEGSRPSSYTLFEGFLPDTQCVIASAIVDGEQRLFLCPSLNGPFEPVTGEGEGFHYGTDIAPDGSALVCHVTGGKHRAGRQGAAGIPYPSYSIHRISLYDGTRSVLYGDESHLYFGPRFSPEGERIVFLDCHRRTDPGHFWADICVAPATIETGAQQDPRDRVPRRITSGQAHWFGTSFGPAEHRGSGSNMAVWAGDGGRIVCTRKIPGSHPDCIYDASRPDHQEQVYRPDLARGGTQLCSIDPDNDGISELTPAEEGRWDFRAAVNGTDGGVAFARARVACPSELWLSANGDGNERRLTAGYRAAGADHPRWMPEQLERAVAHTAR